MSVRVIHGDCIEVMADMEPESFSAVVTDPPAGISFMNAAWDHHKGGRDHWIAWMRTVAAECLRVCKPGAHALVWALPRTSHWTATAWEDAGWQVRDRVAFLFASGFPKSLNVSKAIDRFRDWSKVEALNDEIRRARQETGLSLAAIGAEMQAATMGQYGKWYHRGGHMFFETGRSLPSRPEWERLREVLPISPDFYTVYDAAEREVIGQVCYGREDAPRSEKYRQAPRGTLDITAPATEAASQWQGWGTALKPAIEDWWLLRKPLSEATVAANVLRHGCGALNIDAARIGVQLRTNHPSSAPGGNAWRFDGIDGRDAQNARAYADRSKMREPQQVSGRWPANVAHDGSPEVLDAFAKFGERPARPHGPGVEAKGMFGIEAGHPGYPDNGSAARFFFSAKAGQWEREGNHPTVKPLALLEWLVTLITPPNGRVLDPFAGTGTTLVACDRLGFDAVGIELSQEYVTAAEDKIRRLRARRFIGPTDLSKEMPAKNQLRLFDE